MFRKSLLALPVMALLAACSTTGTLTAPTAASIQAAAVAACGFLPTASTVANLLTTNANVQSAEAVAAMICNAVVAKGGRLGGAAPSVNGVAIHGQFVR